MEPTRLTVRAVLALRRAAHFERQTAQLLRANMLQAHSNRGRRWIAIVIGATLIGVVLRAQGPQQAQQIPSNSSQFGSFPDWLIAVGTLVVAVVAVFQETIRAWFYRPRFHVSVTTAPPDCVAGPFCDAAGSVVADSIYLRLWVENVGNATARNAEVFAKELRRRRADGTWERVTAFPPMNLKWANVGAIYFSSIAPEMGKHCDVAHIADPARRHLLREDSPALSLTNQESSLAFDVMVAPNHRGHIVRPGEYQLDILVAAENVRPKKWLVKINVRGPWYQDEAQMLRDGVGISVE